MNTRPGPTANLTPLRTMNMNYGPAPPASRATLGNSSSRLQNTHKPALGNGTGWGFGMTSPGGFGGLGGAPGLAGPARPLSGFAQVMGGGNGQGPIDMSDFPSLSGGPQPNSSAGASAAWNSNSSAIRQAAQPQQQQPAVQRPSHQPQRAPSLAPSQQSIEQTYDGQRSQEPSTSKTGSGDEFPPLGGQGQLNGFNNGVQSPDGQIQLPYRDGFPNQQAPIGQGQRSQVQPHSTQPHSTQPYSTQPHSTQPHITQPHSTQRNAFAPLYTASPTAMTDSQPIPQSTQNSQPPRSQPGVKNYADMTEDEKYGLTGLLAIFEARKQIDSGGEPDQTLPASMRSSLLFGQDLGSLGLDLDSPEPLYPTFTPFPAATAHGTGYDYHDNIAPDFTLPSAYKVSNVPPLANRIGTFSDETLFCIFFENPKDIKQELAAAELNNREWRWHKVLRQWLQKDNRENSQHSSLQVVDLAGNIPVGAPPQRLDAASEKGVYVFFDANNWRRERREFILSYAELDVRSNGAGTYPISAVHAPQSASVMGMGSAGASQGNGPVGGGSGQMGSGSVAAAGNV